jgi:hypothetical protein
MQSVQGDMQRMKEALQNLEQQDLPGVQAWLQQLYSTFTMEEQKMR